MTLAAGEDLLSSTRAVGEALVPGASRKSLVVVGGAAHIAISLGWGVVLSALLPRRRTIAAGVLAGLGIAALDLGVIGRRLPSIRALDPGPQILDHVAYGLVVGSVISRLRSGC